MIKINMLKVLTHHEVLELRENELDYRVGDIVSLNGESIKLTKEHFIGVTSKSDIWFSNLSKDLV